MSKPIDPRIEQILGDIDTYQRIALEDYDVPQWQALPPASAPDIAFRPSCSQLKPVWEQGQTAWVWEAGVIYETPGQATATPETFLELQGAGVCITGTHAEDVPLVPTDDVMAKFQAQTSGAVAIIPEPAPAPVEQVEQPAQPVQPVQVNAGVSVVPGNPWSYLFLIVGCGLAIAGFGWSVFRVAEPPKSRHQKTNFRQPARPVKPASQAEPAAVEEYDFRL
jgi:hypothetical protein